MTGHVAPTTDRQPTDDELRAAVRAHVTEISAHVREIVRLLGEHSTNVDYHGHLLKRAINEIGEFARTVEHLERPTPAPYRPEPEQGPAAFESGPKRYKLMVRLRRPAIVVHGDESVELDAAAVKKHERARFFDSGWRAQQDARLYAYRIDEWVASVQILDRLTQTLWTYDAEGNCTELPN